MPAAWGLVAHLTPGSQARGLHGGNRSWDSYGHWECLLSCVREKPLVGSGVTSQESLGWEGPSASPAQDSGQSLPSPSPACPEPGALPGKPQTARKSGQLGGRGCGPGRLLKAVRARLLLTGRAQFSPLSLGPTPLIRCAQGAGLRPHSGEAAQCSPVLASGLWEGQWAREPCPGPPQEGGVSHPLLAQGPVRGWEQRGPAVLRGGWRPWVRRLGSRAAWRWGRHCLPAASLRSASSSPLLS